MVVVKEIVDATGFVEEKQKQFKFPECADVRIDGGKLSYMQLIGLGLFDVVVDHIMRKNNLK